RKKVPEEEKRSRMSNSRPLVCRDARDQLAAAATRGGAHPTEGATMSIKTLNPYLNFNGTAAKAIKLYESALGAKTEAIQHFGDAPGMNVPADQKGRVLHAVLRL